jgi:hypothetical protein
MMKTIAILPLTLSLAAFGCSSQQLSHTPHVAEAPLGLRSAHVIPMTFDSIEDSENPYVSAANDSRKVGDWVASDFTNAGKPIKVEQRVLSRQGAMTVVEVVIKDGAKSQTFRIRSETTRAGEQVLDATRVEGGIEHASTIAAYEAALQKTIPNVDRNDGMLDVEPISLDIGGRKVEAVRTTFKVVVGGKPATMSVIHSDTFAWGDLGGDIVTEAGKTLYTTRVVDTGTAPKAVASERY